MTGKRRGAQETVSAKEAGRRLGMTDVAVGQWGKKPGAPVRLEGGKRTYVWPDFPVWYRNELTRNREKPTTFEDARTRKMTAEAELAEIELAKARADALALGDMEALVARDYRAVRGKLQGMTGRLAPEVVGVKSIVEATARIEPVVQEIMAELSR
jgi:hypothetical protein